MRKIFFLVCYIVNEFVALLVHILGRIEVVCLIHLLTQDHGDFLGHINKTEWLTFWICTDFHLHHIADNIQGIKHLSYMVKLKLVFHIIYDNEVG